MNPFRLVASILVVAVVACVACGGGDDVSNATGGSSSNSGNPSAGTSVGGSAASGSTGVSGSATSGGSNATAGKSGGAGSGGAAAAGAASAGGGTGTGAHCTPGTVQPSFNFVGGIIDQCASVNGLVGDYNHLLDIEPPKPIGPGDSFAFSVDMKAPEGDFEVYGATTECGDVGEKLSTVHVLGNGIICHAVKPVTGTYSHLIWVWRVAAEMKDMAMCDSGTCPGK